VSSYYDDSPHRLDARVSPDEADAVASLDQKQFSRAPTRVAHYTARVALTIRALHAQIRALHNDIQKIQISRASAGAPATLSPTEAVRYLTDEQLVTILGARAGEVLTGALQSKEAALATRAVVVARINEAKLLLGSLSNDPQIPDEVQKKVTAIQRRFDVALSTLTPATLAPPTAVTEGLGAIFRGE
jgi:hypothetical protein